MATKTLATDRAGIAVSDHPYIDTAEKLIECVEFDPQHIVNTLEGAKRFANQHPTSTILRHSVEVWDAVDYVTLSTDARIWAMMHDMHEMVTGDTPLGFKAETITWKQIEIDLALRRAFGLNVSSFELSHIEAVDRAVGKLEYEYWQDYKYQTSASAARLLFLDTLIGLGKRIK